MRHNISLMADAKTQDPPIIKPTGGQWMLAQTERELHVTAQDVPNWRLANKARKMLADLVHQLSESVPKLGQPEGPLDATIARQIAGIQLAAIAVRSTGAVLVLVGTGYQPEAAAPLRRLVESVLRVRAVLDDASGEHARSWLDGRPQGTTERLAQRYAQTDEVRILSVLAHADNRALLPVVQGDIGSPDESAVDIRPSRNTRDAERILFTAAYETSSHAGSLAELFEVTVQMPSWLSGELKRSRARILKKLGGNERP